MIKLLIPALLLMVLAGCRKPDYLNNFRNERPTYVDGDFREFIVKNPIRRAVKTNLRRIERLPRDCSAILIDFDGGRLLGSMWNVYKDTIDYLPSGFTAEAQQRILDSMKADFAKFNIYVTVDSLEWAHKANPLKRTIIRFTMSYEWYPGQAGGVAVTGSFVSGSDEGGWVFSSLLGYVEKYNQIAGSHEAGHTLGCRHQVIWNAECSSWVWNPNAIMGVGYNSAEVYWWNGTTSAGCNSYQCDECLIANIVGYK